MAGPVLFLFSTHECFYGLHVGFHAPEKYVIVVCIGNFDQTFVFCPAGIVKILCVAKGDDVVKLSVDDQGWSCPLFYLVDIAETLFFFKSQGIWIDADNPEKGIGPCKTALND